MENNNTNPQNNPQSVQQSANNHPAAGDRTFTQEQVNAIIGERLSKEKEKNAAALAEREQQFAERERQLANKEAIFALKDQLHDMGLPAELLPVLNVQDKPALDKALQALKGYIDEKSKKKDERVYQPYKLPEHVETDIDNEDAQLRKAMRLHR